MFIIILTMQIIASYDDYNFLALNAHGEYVEFIRDEDGDATRQVFLDPGGPPRRVRTWRPPSHTPGVFDPRPIEEWM